MTPSQSTSASVRTREGFNAPPPLVHRPFSDPNRLAPEDAFFAHSPPRRQRERAENNSIDGITMNGDLDHATLGGAAPRRARREKERGRSGSRKNKGVWKKLLWVKHPLYPDNYTDPPTFLSHLQRNPRLLPYDFWPLVADSTVIVQHLCSVAIFICCFVGIVQERVSPVSVVSWGSAGTVLGWVFWDFWIGQEEAATLVEKNYSHGSYGGGAGGEDASSVTSTTPSTGNVAMGGTTRDGLGIALSTSYLSSRDHSRNLSASSLPSASSVPSPIMTGHPTGASQFTSYSPYPPYNTSSSPFSPRNQQRLATAKSAVLIYCALLGLSPILKSLTKSTTSDSIWALSCWLMCINVFFFDYGGGVGVKFPASLSTNAALMSSTVLASRLPSTTHVFSLTLFSIEVFGLFPVFRRILRHRSWRLHLALTILLIGASGAGMGLTLMNVEKRGGAIVASVVGAGVWGAAVVLGMGVCSWWLIGLQKYKNVVIGPWDPARPVLRGGLGWD